MKEYHFKYQNNKGGLYFLLAIFGGFLTIPPSVFLLEYILDFLDHHPVDYFFDGLWSLEVSQNIQGQ